MRIAILGAGKMGRWLAGQFCREHEVAVYDHGAGRAEHLQGVKALQALPELAGFSPQLLINAVSLQNTLEAFREAAPYLPKGCIIADVASVKDALPGYYSGCGFRFASVHPMFGPTFADMDSLREENAVIISESDPEGAGFFREFFEGLGVRTYDYSFREHDQMMAYSLTTPFISSLVFASCVDSTAVPGTTFARHMKIAKGLLSEEDHLLCEVLFNPHSLPQLDRITARLEYLKHIIKGRDREEAKKFLDKLRKKIG